MDERSATKRSRNEATTNLQQTFQQQQQQQSTSLHQEYRTIAELVGRLDQQTEVFSKRMKHLIETAPAHDGLAALWEEQRSVLVQQQQHECEQNEVFVVSTKPGTTRAVTTRQTPPPPPPPPPPTPIKKDVKSSAGTKGIINDDVINDPDDPILLLL